MPLKDDMHLVKVAESFFFFLNFLLQNEAASLVQRCLASRHCKSKTQALPTHILPAAIWTLISLPSRLLPAS